MASPIKVPRLGWTMEEGVFVEWLKPEGAMIAPGDLLFTLEGEKAAQEIESIEGGILRMPPDAPRPGQTVPVGAVLGYLLAADEEPPWEAEQANGGRKPPGDSTSGERSQQSSQPAASATSVTSVTKSSRRLGPTASPRARRLAAELRVDWTSIIGTGGNGRIRERDVRRLAANAEGPTSASCSISSGGRLVPLSAARRTIAQRMSASARAVAPVTLVTKADATNLVSFRDQFEAAGDAGNSPRPSYTDLVVKLAGMALAHHPSLNAAWHDDGVFFPESIDIAVAVDTDAGLLAPVVRRADTLGLRQLAMETRRLIARARARRLTADELRGGTFTVTNLGMYGIDAFTPIVNLPQCAVLGIGRIVREPAVVGEAIVPRDMLTLSLTFDHRVVDGAPAARFLDTIRQAVERPAPWLVA